MNHLTALDLDVLMEQARTNPRRRQHRNLHLSPEEPCQRLLNAVCRDSYIRPHRHSQASTDECLLAIRGRFALLQFAGDGTVTAIHRFGAGEPVAIVQLAPKVWHTVIALTDDAVLFEAKSGPYVQDQAKEWADWSPAEGSSDQAAYLERLHGIVIRVEEHSVGGC